MDPGVSYVTTTTPPPPVVGYGSSAGIWALVLVIIVIIFLIILAVVFFRDTAVITNLVNFWTTVQGTTTTPEAFTASPNSIYLASSSAPANMTVTINQPPDINSVVVGTRAAEFKISNTVNANTLTVNTTANITPVAGQDPSIPFGSIAKGQTATYMWLTPTSVIRLE